ncbi:MAG: fatty acid desaturase [Hyphomicrobiaceae bacterium]
MTNEATAAVSAPVSRDLVAALSKYRDQDPVRSTFELLVTAVPLVVLWIGAWAALSVSFWLTLLLAIPASAFLLRMFMIQHDCGHGSFFRRRATNDWVGRLIGVITLTPYDAWRHSHAVHHATSGNLDQRGTGDINTLTVREYLALPPWRRLVYRLYRHPAVMFGIGPAYLFLLRNRIPLSSDRPGARSWISTMATNVGIALFITGMIKAFGVNALVLVHLPIVLLSASIGVWLFYVQHQYEDTYWAHAKQWQHHEAAVHGSSHYDLPPVLRWFTANIGVHHVHHLCSRIPFYRLQKVLREHPQLAGIGRMTIRDSLKTVKLKLWDEDQHRLVSFKDIRQARTASGN